MNIFIAFFILRMSVLVLLIVALYIITVANILFLSFQSKKA